ncbi:MAG: TlpA disulfide reductase family protein [Myxococcota bacterium]
MACAAALLLGCAAGPKTGPSPGSSSPSSSSAEPAAAQPTAPAGENAPLPPLSYALLDGSQWTAQSARDEILVIDVWATWCVPCRKAFPKLEHIATAYQGVSVVAISVDEEDSVVEKFLAEVPVSFTIARDPTLSLRDGPLGVSKLPTVLIVDRAGVIRYRGEQLNVADYDQVERMVAELVRSGS